MTNEPETLAAGFEALPLGTHIAELPTDTATSTDTSEGDESPNQDITIHPLPPDAEMAALDTSDVPAPKWTLPVQLLRRAETGTEQV